MESAWYLITTYLLPTAVALFLATLVKNLVQGRCPENDKQQALRFHRKQQRPSIGTVIGTVSEINVFPAKSMSGYPLRKCTVNNAGLNGDRLVMVVKQATNVVITQRMVPQLSQISATVNQDSTIVTLSYPGTSSKPLKLDLSSIVDTAKHAASIVMIDLHSIKANCVDLGEEAAQWIDSALTFLCCNNTNTPKMSGYRIFTLASNEELRKVYSSPAILLMEHARPFDATRLSDLAPITFASEASLRALNQAATETVPMNRFRTNIVAAIDEDELAFLEDHIHTLQIGYSLQFRSMGPTFRCVIPSIDQRTGEAGFRKNIRSAEPIATLKRLRSGGLRFGLSGLGRIEEGGSKSLAPLFGVYLGTKHSESSGEVSVGDPIRVIEYKREPGVVAQLIDALAMTLGLDRAA